MGSMSRKIGWMIAAVAVPWNPLVLMAELRARVCSVTAWSCSATSLRRCGGDTTVRPEPGEMEAPLYSVSDLEDVVRDFKAVGGRVTFNAGIFKEGGPVDRTVDQLTEVDGRLTSDTACLEKGIL